MNTARKSKTERAVVWMNQHFRWTYFVLFRMHSMGFIMKWKRRRITIHVVYTLLMPCESRKHMYHIKYSNGKCVCTYIEYNIIVYCFVCAVLQRSNEQQWKSYFSLLPIEQKRRHFSKLQSIIIYLYIFVCRTYYYRLGKGHTGEQTFE